MNSPAKSHPGFDDKVLQEIYGYSPSWHDMVVERIEITQDGEKSPTIEFAFSLLDSDTNGHEQETKGTITFTGCSQIELTSELSDIYNRDIEVTAGGLKFTMTECSTGSEHVIVCQSCTVKLRELWAGEHYQLGIRLREQFRDEEALEQFVISQSKSAHSITELHIAQQLFLLERFQDIEFPEVETYLDGWVRLGVFSAALEGNGEQVDVWLARSEKLSTADSMRTFLDACIALGLLKREPYGAPKQSVQWFTRLIRMKNYRALLWPKAKWHRDANLEM